jgi:hypothetical protein
VRSFERAALWHLSEGETLKRTFLLAALVVAALSMTAVAFASPSPVSGSNAKACNTSGTALVNVHYTLTNDYDSAIDGHAWANDTIVRQLQIWALGSGTYCVSVSDQGSFVTFAGTSPQGTGTVSAGIIGKIKGGYSGSVTGTYAATRPVSGNLGTFDLACTDAYNCPGTHPSYLDYFNGITTDNAFAVWGWNYHTSQNGTWNNLAAGNNGDITS